MNKLPLAKPYVGEEEIKAVTEVILSGQLSLGSKLPEFEKMFVEFIGSKHAIAVNSGTSGLHLCMAALNLSPEDEVITSPFSFVASSNPIIYVGAKPIFADIDEETYNLNPTELEKAITGKTKAIVVVHLFGQSCDMDAIKEIAEKKGIPIIEDACEALGAKFNGKKIGSFGKMAVFAFYPNKHITTGEGGIILTEDDETAELCRSLRNQGRDNSGEWLNHVRLGYNYRLDEMSCAIGIEQLKKINLIIQKRQQMAKEYIKRLEKINEIIIPYADKRAENSPWVLFLRVKDGLNRNRLLEYLNEHGVSSRAYFEPPIHLQPLYREMFGYSGGEFPIAEKVAGSGFIVPFFIGLTNDDIERVCFTIKKAVRNN